MTSDTIGVCVNCLRKRPRQALEIAAKAHITSQAKFRLPPAPPAGGFHCGVCGRGRAIPEGATGYCGLVKNVGRRLTKPGGDVKMGVLTYYYDPIPINCVADWVYPATMGRATQNTPGLPSARIATTTWPSSTAPVA